MENQNMYSFQFQDDRPIKDSSEDLLNRKSLAESLTKNLLENFKNKIFSEDSFSIGIYGEWGSGKTSLLNMVLEPIKKQNENQDQKIAIVEFNPWLYSDQQQMISQFFKQLTSEIKELNSKRSNAAWKIIAKYGDMFEVANFIPTIGSTLAFIFKKLTSFVRLQINTDNSLQKQKDKIIDSLTKVSLKDDLKIIVTIDDIDRLTKEQIIAIFQLVKNLANFPNTVYLLAFDYDTVIKALDDVQCNKGNGEEYLKKIIQMPIHIPDPNMDTIHNAFLKKIETISSKNIYETLKETALLNDGIKPYIKSLRDVYRFANAFYSKYQHLSEETDLTDLLGLTCLQVFEPYLYSNLPKEKELLSENHYFANGTKDHLKNELTKFFNNVAINREISARLILGCLFPVVDNVFDLNREAKFYNRYDLLWGKKIASEACFDRYFSLTLEENAIKSSELNTMILEMSREELTQKLKDCDSGKINRFIKELIAFVNASQSPDLPEDRAALLIEIIIQQWDFLIRNTTPGSIYSLLKQLLDKTIEKFKFLSELFENSQSNLSALGNLLDILLEPYVLGDKDRQLISHEEITSLKENFIKRASDAFNNWIGGNYDDNLKYLRWLEKLKPNLNPKEKIKEKIKTHENNKALAFIISHCSSVSLSRLNNIKCWDFNFDTGTDSFKEFISDKDAFLRMDSYVKSEEFFNLPEEIQMDVVDFFLRYKQPELKHEEIPEEQIIKELKRLEEERNRNDLLY